MDMDYFERYGSVEARSGGLETMVGSTPGRTPALPASRDLNFPFLTQSLQ